MENKFKFTLIISQYYHSWHYFIVEHNEETFIKQMQELTKELDKYKGGGIGDKRINQSDPYYGDLGTIRYRYNVNANGDIYFINSHSVNDLQQIIQRDINDTRYSRQGFKKKAITDDINKNHNYNDVSKIINKYFEID